MKRTLTALVLAAASASPALAADATGTWQTEPGDTGGVLHVTVAPCGSAVCGTIKHAFSADKSQNTTYEHLGKQMIWDMAAEGEGRWAKGKIWAPDSDKTYRAKMELLSADQLKVSGCVAGGLICRGQTWIRVK